VTVTTTGTSTATATMCECTGTGPGGVSATVTCGETACGDNYKVWSCNAGEWYPTGQSCPQ
jgi:hypothetical protein